MKRRNWLLLLAALLVGVAAFALMRPQPEVRVLVFSKTAGYRHESIEAGKEAFKQLSTKQSFELEFSEDSSIFNENDLSRFKVVVFLNTTGDVLGEAQQLEFNRFIQAGGGFVGLHAASDTEYEWGWYGGLVGAYFNGHPNNPNVREATIEVVDGTHSSTKMLPESWTRMDEWYNYKTISPNIKVLLNLDESSYEGGTNGESHPIAWYQEYDGGRMFYTGLGHTNETFAEPLFLAHLWGGLEYVIGDGAPVDFSIAKVAPEENRFNKVVLDQGLYEPMELEMLPNRNILFIERRGKIKLYDQIAKETRVVAEMDVYSGQEDGLLGVALDPNYAENNWIYMFHSPVGDVAKQHISRFVFDGETLDKESEKVLLEVPTQREECCHSGGSMEFGPNGNLFISLGDDTNPHASDGFAPIDDRDDRRPWDALRSAGNTQDLRGKILRIKPEADGTYSIPEGNLFSDEQEGRPEIYVMGCRNPFRIAIDPATGYLYWGEVGPDAGEPADDRGPAGHDEVNQAREAGFFGWPLFVGNNKPYHDYDFETTESMAAFDPKSPVNPSTNNTGAESLPPAQPAFIWYPYGNSPEFPLVGDGGRNAMAGPVFHLDTYADNPGRYPSYYNGKLFTYDWMRGWIMAVTMDEEGNYKRMERFLPNMVWNNPVDMLFGPDGDLWVLEYGTKWFAQNEDARLVHLEYISGNREPIARIDANELVGGVPLTVNFDGRVSEDFDGDALQYTWTFGEGGPTSTEANPSYTFDKPGRYLTTLLVDDGAGKSHQTSVEVLVGNAPPTVAWNLEGNTQFFFPDQAVTYNIQASDPEDGTLGEGLDAKGLVATIDYLERGFDRNEIAMGHQAMVEASAMTVGQQLVMNSDCQTCHQMKERSVGPSYQEVAEKYAADPTAISMLAGKIIKGGAGNWGQIAMAAHPQIAQDEAEQMVKYILAQGDAGNVANNVPLKGTYSFDQHQAGQESGSYIFTLSYTDKGAQGIESLSGQEMLILRYPKIEAEKANGLTKAMVFDVTPDMLPGLEEAFTILIGERSGEALYKDIDLTGVKSMEILASAISAYMDGGTVEVRLDQADGQLLASVEVESKMIPSSDPSFVDIPAISGKHDLYFLFIGAEDGNKPVCTLDWFKLHNTPVKDL